MRRLIDADDVISLLANHYFDDSKEVKSVPTVYDPDKVVRQLEEYREEMEQFGCSGMLSDMIEVVKGGGVDGD